MSATGSIGKNLVLFNLLAFGILAQLQERKFDKNEKFLFQNIWNIFAKYF